MSAVHPAWVEHVVWWQVCPLGFLDAPTAADPEVVHRLPSLENWLDYLIELGASGLALGPMFASSSHGYDTIDYYRIDPASGIPRTSSAWSKPPMSVESGCCWTACSTMSADSSRCSAGAARGEGSPAARWFHLFWKGEGPGTGV